MTRVVSHDIGTTKMTPIKVTTLSVCLSGVDPASGADIRLAQSQSANWCEGIIPTLINEVLDKGEKFAGAAGLEGLLAYDVTLSIGLSSSGVWPGFTLDVDTIARISACGAGLDFDPYIDDVPNHLCVVKTDDDFTVEFTALDAHHERRVIAKRRLKEYYGSLEDVFIWQIFKEAWHYHQDNSLRAFREKQPKLTLYARYYKDKTQLVDGGYDNPEDDIRPGFHLNRDVFIRLNAANARFVYWPFECKRKAGA